MNRKSRISFGPGASSLILIMVVLSMSIVGVLSLLSANNDNKLSLRSAEMTKTVYELNARAERRLAELDALVSECISGAGEDGYRELLREKLPSDMQMEEDRISWEETEGNRSLDLSVKLSDGEADSDRLSWVTHRLTAVTEDIWN